MSSKWVSGIVGKNYQCDEENRQIDANDDRPEFERLWLKVLFGIFILVDDFDWLSLLG